MERLCWTDGQLETELAFATREEVARSQFQAVRTSVANRSVLMRTMKESLNE